MPQPHLLLAHSLARCAPTPTDCHDTRVRPTGWRVGRYFGGHEGHGSAIDTRDPVPRGRRVCRPERHRLQAQRCVPAIWDHFRYDSNLQIRSWVCHHSLPPCQHDRLGSLHISEAGAGAVGVMAHVPGVRAGGGRGVSGRRDWIFDRTRGRRLERPRRTRESSDIPIATVQELDSVSRMRLCSWLRV